MEQLQEQLAFLESKASDGVNMALLVEYRNRVKFYLRSLNIFIINIQYTYRVVPVACISNPNEFQKFILGSCIAERNYK